MSIPSSRPGPGASLRLVPEAEQRRQGGLLSGFYRACNVNLGDEFIVSPAPAQLTTMCRGPRCSWTVERRPEENVLEAAGIPGGWAALVEVEQEP